MLKFFKTKVGFTLVELMVVLVILSVILAIGIPAYRNVSKSNRVKVCRVERREVVAEVRAWCNDNRFNEDYSFTITSDGESGTVVAEPASNVEMITNDVFGGEVYHCPGNGTYTITLTKNLNSTVGIKVVCNGGDDGDCHIDE